MPTHCRRLTGLFTLGLSAAAVLGALNIQAATLGHSRVTSTADQPLRIVVQLKDISATEQASLSAQIAPAKAWQEAGLTPPVDLSTLRAELMAGVTPQTMQLVVQSAQVADSAVLDVLVDVVSAASTQRHQVSVLQAKPLPEVALAPITPKTTAALALSVTEQGVNAQTTVSKNSVVVQKNQTLSAITRRLQSDQYTDQQMMIALLQANPQAFIHNNINLLKAGATLQIPDAALVAAISPQQAQQLYQQHVQWFDEYRQRLAKGLAPTPMNSGLTPEPNALTEQSLDAGTDRLQLAAATESEKKSDQAASLAQELDYTAQRLAQLESQSGAGGSAAQPVSSDAQSSATLDAQSNTPSSITDAVSTTQAVPLTTPSTDKSVQSASWFAQDKWIWLGGLLALAALLVAWFLRRAQSSNLAYAEAVPESADRVREKLEKINLDLDSPPTDEVEFREIK